MSIHNLTESNNYDLYCDTLTSNDIESKQLVLNDGTNNVVLKPYNTTDLQVSGGISAKSIIFKDDQKALSYYNDSGDINIEFKDNNNVSYPAKIRFVRVGSFVNLQIKPNNSQFVVSTLITTLDTGNVIDPDFLPNEATYSTMATLFAGTLEPVLLNISDTGRIQIIATLTGGIPAGTYFMPAYSTGYIH